MPLSSITYEAWKGSLVQHDIGHEVLRRESHPSGVAPDRLKPTLESMGGLSSSINRGEHLDKKWVTQKKRSKNRKKKKKEEKKKKKKETRISREIRLSSSTPTFLRQTIRPGPCRSRLLSCRHSFLSL